MDIKLDTATSLPIDREAATLVGRAFLPASEGPAVVAVRGDLVIDISRTVPTMADLMAAEDPVAIARDAPGHALGAVGAILGNSVESRRDATRPWLLAPTDLQAIKAAGVTFVASMLERVIEEQARGDAARAQEIRSRLAAILGHDLTSIRPGSPEAAEVKRVLIDQGAWSQYLEVGIGPDAELFTKSQPMSAVGTGADVGIHPISTWNNPEPEIVLVVAPDGKVKGASLGNDVNLRDVEGRSALLLGKAKDNNGSCAIGPLIRLFDEHFGIGDVRRAEIELVVEGDDGFRLDGSSSMAKISRDPLDLAAQAVGPNHQYPDGLVLFCGTMFAPIRDRHAPGQGFTHDVGDRVTIRSEKLGALVNRVRRCNEVAPWTFGTRALMRNLARRGLL